MSDDFRLDLDSDVSECGELVSGTVRWGPLAEEPRRLVVQLQYRTQGAGEVDTDAADEVKFAGSATGEERFELRVPLEGPMSFEGSLIQLIWEVTLSVDHRDRAAQTITVLPGGGLAMWARQMGVPPRG